MSTFPLETIVSRAKRKWFVYPNSDIYGWLANAWDYGPYGSLLKKNISDLWIKHFTTDRDDVIYMDTAIIAHPMTWVASWHVWSFADALIDDKVTGQRFRADKIIEAKIEEWTKILTNEFTNINNANSSSEKHEIYNKSFYKKLESKIAEKAINIIKDSNKKLEEITWSDKNNSLNSSVNSTLSFDNISQWVEEYLTRYVKALFSFENLSPEARGNEWMHKFILQEIPNNPDKKQPQEADWTECRNFNLMLDTHLWPVADDANKVYMRPETCQSLFTDFKMVTDTTRNRVPFWLAQVGKAFRNEITPWQFLFRTREFEQMEIEYFIPAESKLEIEEDRKQENIENSKPYYDQWKKDSRAYWTEVLGINPEHLRFKDHDKLAHYAAAATDVEYAFPWGFGEVQWVHNRTDFDLQQHQKHSGTSMQYIDPKSWARYVPRCIEASRGLGRQVMVTMLEFYDEETLTKENSDGTTTEDTRIVVRFPFHLAPVKFAVLPLLEKSDEMVEVARKLQKLLRQAWYVCEYDGSGGIGKRYRRQDEIGTPYCITIDHQTLEDGTYTVRDRDTMEQLGEEGRMTVEEIAMLEYELESDCDCEDDCDCHVQSFTEEKVCCGWGCGCH